MRVCVISTPIFQLGAQGLVGYGGLEQLAWLAARGLAKKGHEVALVAPEGSQCEGATVISIGQERSVDERGAYNKYWQELPKFDVIIDHSWNKWALILKSEGRLNSPVLCWTHAPVNTMFQTMPPVDKPCFVCISQDQALHFSALFSKEAKVCYNGVDPSFYKSLGIKRTDRCLFLARFSTIKGADLAIEACKKTGVGLDLIGDTSITNEPEFFHKCKSMTDGEKIQIVGPATRGETVWWYSQADLFLHPNQRFREPFGLAPVEAMCCGLPVCAFDYGAMRETIKHEETGWLIKSVDDMAKVIMRCREEGISLDMRRRCREWASQFSIERMIGRCEELCVEAIEGGGW